MADEFDSEIEAAERRGKEIALSTPRAASVRFNPLSRRVELEMSNGCGCAFPVAIVQDLQGAADVELAVVEIDGGGFNLSWPKLNVDLFVPLLLDGVFGSKRWMGRFNAATKRMKSAAE